MLRAPQPLRSGGDEDESSTAPEALLISAFLEEGLFQPEKYHVSTDDIEAWKKLWNFCIDYQTVSGTAPPVSLVKKQFPDFEVHPNVSTTWAALKVRDAGSSRAMRHQIRETLSALNNEDLETAYTALAEVQRPRSFRKEPISVFDHTTVAMEFDVAKIEVPYASLGRATGGIGPGELWYLAARLGAGKTWFLLKYASRAAKAGYRVGIHSLEMPAQQMARRSHQLLCEGNATLLAQLRSEDIMDYKEALDIIASSTPGSIEVLDPSHGRINTTAAVAESCHDYDLVIVDHVGLLVSDAGHRAIDDWRSMALISNTLREITLATSTPVLGAAQTNRESERAGTVAPPKASQLAQSDSLGQDADVVLTMKRLSERTMVHSAEKVRHGPNLRWYTRFDPDKNKFEEISSEQQKEIALIDEDRKESLV